MRRLQFIFILTLGAHLFGCGESSPTSPKAASEGVCDADENWVQEYDYTKNLSRDGHLLVTGDEPIHVLLSSHYILRLKDGSRRELGEAVAKKRREKIYLDLDQGILFNASSRDRITPFEKRGLTGSGEELFQLKFSQSDLNHWKKEIPKMNPEIDAVCGFEGTSVFFSLSRSQDSIRFFGKTVFNAKSKTPVVR